mgnify:CR=1 FL=1
MGARKKHAPKRGSLAYLPRARAKRLVPRIKYWPEVDGEPKLLGFAGYKAGMTHVYVIDDTPGSPNFGKEIVCPVTVIDVPPMFICAIRAYVKTDKGLKTFTEAWIENPPKDLERVFPVPEKFNREEALKKIEENLDKIADIRVLAITQPRLASGVPKKKPDLMEIKIGGGTIKDRFEYAKEILGKEVSITDVFKEGQYVDVVAVSKGKGFQGAVKRWGIKILPRKKRKGRRKVAALGPWHPARVLYTVPQAGQLGFHKRTEYNKRIIKIGEDGSEITPKGGFPRYGVVRGSYVLIKGSVPGPPKRIIRFRYPARPPKTMPEGTPQITYVSVESKQGV